MLVRCSFTPREDGFTWQVDSRNSACVDGKEAWRTQAHGCLAPLRSSAPKNLSKGEIKTVIERCSENLNRDDFYRRIVQQGYGYGTTFQGIAQLWWNSTEAVAHIVVDGNRSGPATSVIPGVLDSCFQVSLFAGLTQGLRSAGDLYIPVGLDHMEIYGPIKGPLWCHCKLRDVTRSMARVDFCIYDDAGVLLARIDRLLAFRVKRLIRDRSHRKS